MSIKNMIASIIIMGGFSLHLLFGQPALYNIVDFGAVGDGVTLNTQAFQDAVDRCSGTGGGTVYVPPGTFVTGSFILSSRVNLYLESGATILGSPNIRDYRDYFNGADSSHYGIIYAEKAENVSITGFGAIHGNDRFFFEWDKAKKIEPSGLQYVRQLNLFRHVASGIGDGPVVPKIRPRQMIIFSQCRDVTVRDVKLLASPFWTLHFADCDGVVVSGIRLWADMLSPNADGIDVTSSSNVLISDCDIRCGDDCIAITGYDHHFELPGYHYIRHLSENISVSNCNLQSRSSGIRIGGLDQNSMRNYQFSNINITHSNRGIGLFLRDEGSIENMTFSNICIETRLHTGDWWGHGEPIHISAMRAKSDVKLGILKNIRFTDIVCTSESGILLYGVDEGVLENISFRGVNLKLIDSPLNDVAGGNIDLRPVFDERFQLFSHDIPAFLGRYVKNLSIDDLTVEWAPIDQPFITNTIEIEQFDGVRIENIRIEGKPNDAAKHAIVLKNGRALQTNAPSQWIEKQNVK
ncbi:MAG: hypothetical protein EHM72_16065 [Calditrichaeota bacterium]|nr:MAG: hypothetical protein EHM72_16065 [Calditrichota bacterium]